MAMSRQRDYQRKMRLQERCIICGDPQHVSCYCLKHYENRRAKIRERSAQSLRDGGRRQGSPKTCSVCEGEGHNKRTCPELQVA